MDLSALLGGDEPTAQEQAKALADALRGQRDIGTLAMLTGDKVLGGVGQQLITQAHQQQQAQMQQAQFERQLRQNQAQADYWRSLSATHQQQADTAAKNTELKAQEVGSTQDAMGNPILYSKHGQAGGLTPGAALRTALTGRGGAAGAAGGGGGIMGYSDAAIDQAATQYRISGQMPNLGRGKAATLVLARIANRAAEQDPTANLAGNRAAYKADTTSLGKQQQLMDLTKSWEATGKANLGNLKRISLQLANTGSPWLNMPVRAFLSSATGDPNVIAFRAAHSAVVNEYAKILSGNTGGGGVTEGARHEAEAMLPLDSTPKQIAAAADVLESDAGNRLSALAAQLSETRGRTLGRQPAAEEPATPAPAAKPDREALRRKYGL